MSEWFIRLQKETDYAKKSCFPRQSLSMVYGKILMARQLDAITHDEFMTLNHSCVADGINNPMYFDK